MAAAYHHLAACLACGGRDLEEILDLGEQPLANDFPKEPQSQPLYPLRLLACRSCFHCQQAVAVDPAALFEHYLYASGTSHTLDEFFSQFAADAERIHGGSRPLRILDIAGNDGSLLAKFKKLGHETVSVDPAHNLAPEAERKGIKTHIAFWSSAFAEKLNEQFDIIIAMNVLAHVSDPLDFLAGCKKALAAGGALFVQTSQANMIANGEFDTIYHEHHSFFQTKSLMRLAERAGLRIRSARHVPVHGTSYLWVLGCSGDGDISITAMMEEEEKKGLYPMTAIRNFGDRARAAVEQTRRHIEVERQAGLAPAGYGAAAKGVVFLNFAGCDLDFVADDSPLKQGLFVPGRHIPVLAPEEALTGSAPRLWLITAWNFREEIHARIKAQRPGIRDKFLVAFPEVEVFE